VVQEIRSRRKDRSSAVPFRGLDPVGGGVFEDDAGGLEAGGFGDVVGDAAGGGGVAEALGAADVGDAVALGVGAAGAGVPGEIDAEGVGRAEAGALADEKDGKVGVEEFADFVGDGDAGALNYRDRG
jgi:hypothetical protein